MNTTFRALAAAVAAVVIALTSCDSDIRLDDGASQTTGQTRVIAVSFQDNSTKTQLAADGLTPKFQANDRIKVSNGTASEDCTVSFDGSGNAAISTGLDGELTAVYPAAAAKMDGNAIAGVLVPTVQDGTFASANICKATIGVDATEATFENQTAIFKLSVPEKQDAKGVDYVVKSLAVKSTGENNIADGSKEIKVGDGTSTIAADGNGFYYVSVIPGETASNLYVCAGAGVRKLKGDDAIAANTMYEAPLPVLNGHEYVELEMTLVDINGNLIGTKTYKWATMNVGATEVKGVNSYGDYFMWGAVEKAYSSVDVTKTEGAFTFDAKPASYEGKNTTWNPEKGFAWENAIYTDGVFDVLFENVFTKYTASENEYAKSGTADGKTTLDLADDAANFNWGGSWRMPTRDELYALYRFSSTDKNQMEIDGKGLIFGTYPAQIFLPNAGGTNGTKLYDLGTYCCYMSSSVGNHAGKSVRTCFMIDCIGSLISYGGLDRYKGYSVRAISE